LTIGTSAAYKNGQQFTIDVPPAEIKGRTMISARFVAGSLGATVGWNESTQTITITSTNNASASTSTPNETSQTTDSNFIAAEVTHVVDGDTMDVTYDGKKDTVRLLLVDTPETHHPTKPVEPFGPEASQFATNTLVGKNVQLDLDGPERDKYGRLLVYLWIDNTTFNDMLLKKGLARVAYVYNPPYKHYDEYVADESTAKDQKLGIWSLLGYVTENGYDDSFATQQTN
jgi:micrococcal nuclease